MEDAGSSMQQWRLCLTNTFLSFDPEPGSFDVEPRRWSSESDVPWSSGSALRSLKDRKQDYADLVLDRECALRLSLGARERTSICSAGEDTECFAVDGDFSPPDSQALSPTPDLAADKGQRYSVFSDSTWIGVSVPSDDEDSYAAASLPMTPVPTFAGAPVDSELDRSQCEGQAESTTAAPAEPGPRGQLDDAVGEVASAVPLLGSQVATGDRLSIGSAYHPHLCSHPCRLWAAGNCRAGSCCEFCHMPHPRRGNPLDKRNRDALRQLTPATRATHLAPLLATKVEDLNMGPRAAKALEAWTSAVEEAGRGGKRRREHVKLSEVRRLTVCLGALPANVLCRLFQSNVDDPVFCDGSKTLLATLQALAIESASESAQ